MSLLLDSSYPIMRNRINTLGSFRTALHACAHVNLIYFVPFCHVEKNSPQKGSDMVRRQQAYGQQLNVDSTLRHPSLHMEYKRNPTRVLDFLISGVSHLIRSSKLVQR